MRMYWNTKLISKERDALYEENMCQIYSRENMKIKETTPVTIIPFTSHLRLLTLRGEVKLSILIKFNPLTLSNK